MKFQKSQPAEAEHLRASTYLAGPTEKYGCTTPRKNASP